MLDEPAWKLSEPASDFIQRDPHEGKAASEKSEIRVLYDQEALYFGCMFYDSEPEKIVARLTRRDNLIESDNASIRIDSYHDHQTAFEFTFNAAGVKVDILQFEDGMREDDSWDPVWEIETKITPQGWSAEVKIPFHILRYRSSSDSSEQEWGINFLRYISRKQEEDRWVFTPKKESGFISRFGHLRGLESLPSVQQVEFLPFVVAKHQSIAGTDYRDKHNEFIPNGGLDVKYRLSNSFVIDATINPDFGQVEADPAVLNLSTFETFYPEKRPFFIEGTQIIRFTTFGTQYGPGMFYSRRIGRALSENEVTLPEGGRIESIPQHTTILGAAKITGKTSSGLAVGLMEAITKEERASLLDSLGQKSEQILEPFAHYNLIRLKQDIFNNSTVGIILTSVEKQNRYPAITNGYDWNLKFDKGMYQLDGFVAVTRTTDSDTNRVYGSAGKMQFGKIAGEHWAWTASIDWTAKKYNINDMGFFFRPNDWGPIITFGYKDEVPAAVARNYYITLMLHERSNFDRVNIVRESSVSSGILFANYWSAAATIDAEAGGYDDRETRGNGLYRKPQNYSSSISFQSDNRDLVRLNVSQRYNVDSRIKKSFGTTIQVTANPFSWMEWEITGDYQRTNNQEAWVVNILDDNILKSIFADRTTVQMSLTARSTVTFTRALTLQWYAQLFFAQGEYHGFRQLIYENQMGDFPYTGNPDFNTQALNMNLVLRYEYLPGSTAYLVWSHARSGLNEDALSSWTRNVRETFRIAPNNVLLFKISYWLPI